MKRAIKKLALTVIAWAALLATGIVAPAYAQLPLNRITVGDAVNGGQMTDLTAGVNWYLNPYTKLVFNYIHAYTDDPKLGWNDTDAIGMRAQIDF